MADRQSTNKLKVVGTYRLLRRDAMKAIGRFYSEGEFDISAIQDYPGEVLEVGRSCVDPGYRDRPVMQLLWRGIGAYVTNFDIGLMFGCASFPGTDPDEHAMALSYLHHYVVPQDPRPVALKDRYIDMNRMPKEAVNVKKAWASLPALIRGYLRLNGYVGMGAVVDPEFGTTDVSIAVKTSCVPDRFAQRYR